MTKNPKHQEAIGYFWGAALFIGLMLIVILGFNGNQSSDWIPAILIGILAFLSLGLVAQGIISIIEKKK